MAATDELLNVIRVVSSYAQSMTKLVLVVVLMFYNTAKARLFKLSTVSIDPARHSNGKFSKI